MHDNECHPGVRVAVTVHGHPEITGTIIEVRPFHYRGQGARIVVQCDSKDGSTYCCEFRAQELRPIQSH